MLKRWFLFSVTWLSCLVFYYAYPAWMGWVLLATASILPICSLLVSLPVMLTARLQLKMPETVLIGTQTTMDLTLSARLPRPRWRVRIQAEHPLSGKIWLLQPLYDCPTEHSGALLCSIRRGRIYDYLGLFCLPLKTPADFRLVVLPQSQKPERLPDVERCLALSWKPKAGGGFAETHELRLYQPGDSLRTIHWKLSGKTGKLITRQAMEPAGSRMLLWLYLQGDPQTLDQKLGQLLWLSAYLLQNQLKHDILAYTGEGIRRWQIDSAENGQEAVAQLLACPCLEGAPPAHTDPAPWQCCVGGDGHEAS